MNKYKTIKSIKAPNLTFIAGVALTSVSQAPSVGQAHAVATVVLLTYNYYHYYLLLLLLLFIIIILTGRCLLVAEGESQGPDTITIILVSGVMAGLLLVNICCLIIISLRESLPGTGSQ